MCRRLAALPALSLVVLAVVCLGAPVVRAQQKAYPLPVQLKLNQLTLKKSLFARKKGDTVYFPLRALASALDFVITIHPSDRYADGWFLAQDRRVSFDAAKGTVTSEGEIFQVGADAFLTDMLASRRELYVAREVLNRAWPVSLTVDMTALTVHVNPQEPLPVQRRKKRQRRRERLLNRQERDLDLRHVDTPYRMITAPAVDVNAEADYDDGTANAEQEIDWSQDILGVSASGRLVTRQQGASASVSDVRLMFRRADIVEPLPGPLKDVKFGDVSRRALTRIGGLGRGRGITLSSFPIERAEQFDTTTIEGNAPSNYEAELFRNGRLLRFQRTGSDGRYEFENVPLLFGNNRFRVVLHGPQGQTRERLRVINTSRALARPGQTIARASLIDVGTDFVPVGRSAGSTDRAGLSGTAIVAHGLTKRTSLFGAATTTPTREGRRHYLVAGANTAFGGVSGQLRVLGSTRGGIGADLQALARVGPTRINFSGGYFDGFASPDVNFGANATRFDAEVNTTTRLNLAGTSLNLGLDGQIERERDGTTTLSADTSQRFTLGEIRVNHTLQHDFADRGDGVTEGSLSTSTRLRPLNLRTGISYEIPARLDDARLSARYRGAHTLSFGAEVQQDFTESTTSVSGDVTRRFGPVLLSLTGEWDQADGVSFGLRLNLGFAPAPGGGYEMAENGVTDRGAVEANVFVDRDGDGTRDAEEPPVKGVRFGRDGSGKGHTDGDGRIVLRGFTPMRTNAVTVRERSIDNPFWVSRHEGYAVVPRPGSRAKLDIPIVPTGAVDGTVRLAGSEEGMPGVPIRLVEPDGDTAATTTSSYGGFFAFDRVRYGDYRLKLGNSDNWVLEKSPRISLSHESPVASRQEVVIRRRERKDGDEDGGS